MKDTRDLRDPEKLGKKYLAARKAGRTIESASKMKSPLYKDNLNPIDRYGRPQDLPEG